MMNLESAYSSALNRLAKWRTIFAGWQLGTRVKGDPEGDAVRDHREGSIILRCEMNAILALLIKKGLITKEDLMRTMIVEAGQLERMYEATFPGMHAEDYGMCLDPKIAAETMKGWKP